MHRKPIIAGNWKMYKTAEEARNYIAQLASLVEEVPVRVCLATPFTAIHASFHAAKDTRITIGAQNMHSALEGAYTGEISAHMLKEAGASFVLLGHSERRHYFHESNAEINKKIHRAYAEDLLAILCIGEQQEERESGKTEDVLKQQLVEGLKGVTENQLTNLVIAYEPVWAIGTGKMATPEMAEETHAMIREILSSLFSKAHADRLSILYGGSVKPESISSLMRQPNIDGALVGGASLDPKIFSQIIHNAVAKE